MKKNKAKSCPFCGNDDILHDTEVIRGKKWGCK